MDRVKYSAVAHTGEPISLGTIALTAAVAAAVGSVVKLAIRDEAKENRLGLKKVGENIQEGWDKMWRPAQPSTLRPTSAPTYSSPNGRLMNGYSPSRPNYRKSIPGETLWT